MQFDIKVTVTINVTNNIKLSNLNWQNFSVLLSMSFECKKMLFQYIFKFVNKMFGVKFISITEYHCRSKSVYSRIESIFWLVNKLLGSRCFNHYSIFRIHMISFKAVHAAATPPLSPACPIVLCVNKIIKRRA